MKSESRGGLLVHRPGEGEREVAPLSPNEARRWPHCEPASTHFELGSALEYQPTAVIAKRYTPRHGVRKA